MVAASVLALIDLVALLDSQIVGIAIDMTVGLHLPERHIVRIALLDTPVEKSLQPKSSAKRGVLGRGAHGGVVQLELGEEVGMLHIEVVLLRHIFHILLQLLRSKGRNLIPEIGITFHFPFPCLQTFKPSEHGTDSACVLGLVLGQILLGSVKEAASPWSGVISLGILLALSVGVEEVINDGGQNRAGHILVNIRLYIRNHFLQRVVELLTYLLGHFLRVLITGDFAVPIDGVDVHGG